MKQPAELLTFRWIRFQDVTPVKWKGKTRMYAVINKEYDSHIGIVKWYPGFRKYSFFPSPDTVYETTCLTDIVTFINQLMLDHNIAREKEKNTAQALAQTGRIGEAIKHILGDDDDDNPLN